MQKEEFGAPTKAKARLFADSDRERDLRHALRPKEHAD